MKRWAQQLLHLRRVRACKVAFSCYERTQNYVYAEEKRSLNCNVHSVYAVYCAAYVPNNCLWCKRQRLYLTGYARTSIKAETHISCDAFRRNGWYSLRFETFLEISVVALFRGLPLLRFCWFRMLTSFAACGKAWRMTTRAMQTAINTFTLVFWIREITDAHTLRAVGNAKDRMHTWTTKFHTCFDTA